MCMMRRKEGLFVSHRAGGARASRRPVADETGEADEEFADAFDGAGAHASRELLGVRAGCSRSELKAAYYALAKQHHPDSATAAGADFARLKDAYDELLPHAPR